MLTPLNRVEINTFLDQFPQRTELAEECHTLPYCVQHIVNLLLGRESTDAEPDTAVRTLVAATERAEDVAGLKGGGRACATGGESDVLECHEERLALDVCEGDVHAAGVVTFAVAIQGCVLHGEQTFEEAVRKCGNTLGVILCWSALGLEMHRE